MNISRAIVLAAGILSEAGVANPRRESASLLSFVLQKDATYLIAYPEYQLSETEAIEFEKVVTRRAAREPFHYITRSREFYGLDFEVIPGVLIPRPETEILVEAAIAILRDADEPKFCEIGVGSGCIAVSILHKVGTATAVGVDVSKLALGLAARNASRHQVAQRLELLEGDLFAAVEGRFQVIVSNPPYIPESDLESLQAEVRLFEPHAALSGGTDGLDVVERIIRGSTSLLNTGGFLLIEIGLGQAARVKELFDSTLWSDLEFLTDLQGIPRIAKATLRQSA